MSHKGWLPPSVQVPVPDPSLCPLLFHHYLPPRTPQPHRKTKNSYFRRQKQRNHPLAPKNSPHDLSYLVTIISAFQSHSGNVGGGAGQSEDSLPVRSLQDTALNTFQVCSGVSSLTHT